MQICVGNGFEAIQEFCAQLDTQHPDLKAAFAGKPVWQRALLAQLHLKKIQNGQGEQQDDQEELMWSVLAQPGPPQPCAFFAMPASLLLKPCENNTWQAAKDVLLYFYAFNHNSHTNTIEMLSWNNGHKISEEDFRLNQACIYLWRPAEDLAFVCGKKDGKLARIHSTTQCHIRICEQPSHSHNNYLPGSSNHLAMFALEGRVSWRALKALLGEFPCFLTFYIPTEHHKRLIGYCGSTIQQVMKKHAVYIKFFSHNSNTFVNKNSFNGSKEEGRDNNVLVKTPRKNAMVLEAVRDDLLAMADDETLFPKPNIAIHNGTNKRSYTNNPKNPDNANNGFAVKKPSSSIRENHSAKANVKKESERGGWDPIGGPSLDLHKMVADLCGPASNVSAEQPFAGTMPSDELDRMLVNAFQESLFMTSKAEGEGVVKRRHSVPAIKPEKNNNVLEDTLLERVALNAYINVTAGQAIPTRPVVDNSPRLMSLRRHSL